VAAPDGRGGLVIYGSLQCPFYVQKAVARTAGLPLARVRVIQTPTGGAFGGKEDLPSELCAKAALLALVTGRPVRPAAGAARGHSPSPASAIPSSFAAAWARRQTVASPRSRSFQDADAGAYATLSPPVALSRGHAGAGPTRVPNVHIEARGWYTNNVPQRRLPRLRQPAGLLRPRGLVDMMAAELDMDTVELRRLNMLREGGTTATGHRLETSVGALETLEARRGGGGGGGCNGGHGRRSPRAGSWPPATHA